MPFFGFSRASLRRNSLKKKRTNTENGDKEISSNNNNDYNNSNSKSAVKKLSKEEKLKTKETNNHHSHHFQPQRSKKWSKDEKQHSQKIATKELPTPEQQQQQQVSKTNLTADDELNEVEKFNKNEGHSSSSQESNLPEVTAPSLNPLRTFEDKNLVVESLKNVDSDDCDDRESFQRRISEMPDREIKESPSLDKRAVRRRRKQPCISIHRRSQHFEENPPNVVNRVCRKSRNFEEDIEKCRKARFFVFSQISVVFCFTITELAHQVDSWFNYLATCLPCTVQCSSNIDACPYLINRFHS